MLDGASQAHSLSHIFSLSACGETADKCLEVSGNVLWPPPSGPANAPRAYLNLKSSLEPVLRVAFQPATSPASLTHRLCFSLPRGVWTGNQPRALQGEKELFPSQICVMVAH